MRKSNEVRVDKEKKSDELRVDYDKKERWTKSFS